MASRLESGFLHSPSHSCAQYQGAGLYGVKLLAFRVDPDVEKRGYLLLPSRRHLPEARLPAPRGLQSSWAAQACFPGTPQAASLPPRNPELRDGQRLGAPEHPVGREEQRTVGWCPAPSRVPPESAALTEAL